MVLYESSQRQSKAAKPVKAYGPKRLFWLALGLLCFSVGAIGAFLPLLPTTSFMLLAAFAFAKSSTRLHRWLTNHRLFGPLINDWHQYGAISRQSKFASLISMVFILGLSLIFKLSFWIIMTQAFVLLAVSLFLWTRPEPPK